MVNRVLCDAYERSPRCQRGLHFSSTNVKTKEKKNQAVCVKVPLKGKTSNMATNEGENVVKVGKKAKHRNVLI